MTKEKVEELTDNSPGEPGKPEGEVKNSHGNPWLPVVTLLVFLPLLSFLLAEYVLLPRMQKRIEKVLVAGQTGDKLETGKANSAANNSAEGKEGEIQIYEIKDIISNLIGSAQARYIRVSFVVEGRKNDFVEVVKKNEVRLIDATLSVLSLLTAEDLQKPGIKNVVRVQLLQNFETVLRTKYVEGLYFSQFVVK